MLPSLLSGNAAALRSQFLGETLRCREDHGALWKLSAVPTRLCVLKQTLTLTFFVTILMMNGRKMKYIHDKFELFMYSMSHIFPTPICQGKLHFYGTLFNFWIQMTLFKSVFVPTWEFRRNCLKRIAIHLAICRLPLKLEGVPPCVKFPG